MSSVATEAEGGPILNRPLLFALAGFNFHPWGMAEENNAIYVCCGLHPPLTAMWPRLKKWN